MRRWIAILLVVAVPASAAAAEFVGSAACGQCHEDIYQRWKQGPHARAGELLGEARGDRRCLGCHTTGDAPAGRPAFAGVGCEACHGAGAAYAADDLMRSPALARELGLVDLSTPERRAAACGRCHRAATRLEPFDVEAAWRRVAH